MVVGDRHSQPLQLRLAELRLRAEKPRAPRLGSQPREDRPHRVDISLPQRPDEHLRAALRLHHARVHARRYGAAPAIGSSPRTPMRLTSQGTHGLIPNFVTGASCDCGERRNLREVPAKGDHREQRSRDELAQAAGGARVPILGSGHPLADVFLLKYSPQASELQEGVAFYGRAGNALLKSLQRLHVDPMAIYGTTASSSPAATRRSRGPSSCASCTSSSRSSWL